MQCDLRILDAAGSVAAPRDVGEIFMRPHEAGPTYEYIGAEPARMTDDGFGSVGDLGYVDDEGYLYSVDRRADMIVSGGANVYPAEVEAALAEHERVLDVVVIGLPDDDWGKRVHAIVVTTDHTVQLTDAELDTHVRGRLSAYKAPKSYEFLPQLPRNEAGKIRRSALIAERSQGRTK